MKIIAALTAPASIRKVLDALGLPARAPPIAPAVRAAHARRRLKGRWQQLTLDAV